jgi:integrase
MIATGVSARLPEAAGGLTESSGKGPTGSRPGRGRASGATKRPKLRKPYKAFPLTPHPRGQFCKKINGRLVYFGSDPQEALRRYREHAADLHAGRITRVEATREFTIGDLVNRYLAEADTRRNEGEIEPGTFHDYVADCRRLVTHFGKTREVKTITREDFAELRTFLAKGVKPPTIKRRVITTRQIFKFGADENLITVPLQLDKLRIPNQKTMRKHRAETGRKNFHASEVKQLLDLTKSVQLQAAILLAINCGYGNTDIASLKKSDLDLDAGWLKTYRSKTGVRRQCPLWPETIEAIRRYLREGDPLADGQRSEKTRGLLFVTRNDFPLVRQVTKPDGRGGEKLIEHDVLTTAFRRTLSKIGITIKGLGFYGLRHTFSTIGSETGLIVAVSHIMGHAPSGGDMSAVYRHGISGRLLLQVTEHVRERVLLGTPEPVLHEA